MNPIKEIIAKLKSNKEFSRNFVWRCVQTFGKQGASFVIFIIATYVLSKENMGIYNYVFSALYLLTIFADFGISTATSKYVAEYNVTDKTKLKRVLFNTTSIVFVISIVVTILAVTFGPLWFGEYNKYLLYILPLVFLAPLTSLYDGIYRGLKRFKELAIISLIAGGISLIIAYFGTKTLGLTGALLTQDAMYLIYAIILAIRYWEWEPKFDKKMIVDIGRYSLVFGIATLGYYLFSKVNILIMGQYGMLKEIATYELLNKAFTLYLLPFTILGQVLAPYITEAFTLKKYLNVTNIYLKSLLYLGLLSVVFVPITYFGTKLAISVLMPQYNTELLALILLPVTITYAKNVFGAPINSGIIVSTGHAGIMTVINIIAGGVNVLLSIWAIKAYGFMGVIWVTLFVQLFFTVVLNILYFDKLSKYGEA